MNLLPKELQFLVYDYLPVENLYGISNLDQYLNSRDDRLQDQFDEDAQDRIKELLKLGATPADVYTMLLTLYHDEMEKRKATKPRKGKATRALPSISEYLFEDNLEQINYIIAHWPPDLAIKVIKDYLRSDEEIGINDFIKELKKYDLLKPYIRSVLESKDIDNYITLIIDANLLPDSEEQIAREIVNTVLSEAIKMNKALEITKYLYDVYRNKYR